MIAPYEESVIFINQIFIRQRKLPPVQLSWLKGQSVKSTTSHNSPNLCFHLAAFSSARTFVSLDILSETQSVLVYVR